jgi:hypothetical protein
VPERTPVRSLRLQRVEFRRFKALGRFALTIEGMNVLVGPNNAGKSTIIDAFRLLAAGFRTARSRPPEYIRDPDDLQIHGWRVPVEIQGVSVTNVHTDYGADPARVIFVFNNDSRIELFFHSEDDTCFLVARGTERIVRSASDFRRFFPITIGLVPVLGPVEEEEPILDRDTVVRNLDTRRASRNFRNFWWLRGSSDFDQFRQLLSETWPGMEMKPVEAIVTTDRAQLAMYCAEDRIDRELFWSGFGFQVWCQILTHLVRHRGAVVLAIDEAELYLHPSLQRVLVSLLRDLGPDIVLATHSSEIVAEADPDEVVLIEKTRRSGRRIRSAEGTRAALTALGSNRNSVLTQLSRTRKALLVEGDDFKTIQAFARKLGLDRLATGFEFAVCSLGGFRAPSQIRSLAEGMEQVLGESVEFAIVMDRDYRPTEQVTSVERGLRWASYRHVLRRKELENYLLEPSVLTRAIAGRLFERAERSGITLDTAPDAQGLLDEATNDIADECKELVVAGLVDVMSRDDIDEDVTRTRAVAIFDEQWARLDGRLKIVPGKEVLSRLNQILQARYDTSVSVARIVATFRPAEVPDEIAELLRALEQFRIQPRETERPVGHLAAR